MAMQTHTHTLTHAAWKGMGKTSILSPTNLSHPGQGGTHIFTWVEAKEGGGKERK